MVVMIVLVSLFFFFSIEAIGWALKRRGGETETLQSPIPFSEIHLPKGLFVDEHHSWARLTESGELRLGADEFLTEALGGADKVELPQPGSEIARGEALATIWRAGRQLVIPSPVNGTVVSANEGIERHPSALAEDPYGSGWLATVWPVEHTEALKSFKLGESAVNWLRSEVQRFTEFLARQTSPEMVGATLPDGARPVVGAALALPEESWEKFQKEFF